MSNLSVRIDKGRGRESFGRGGRGIAEMLWGWTGERCLPLQINCGH